MRSRWLRPTVALPAAVGVVFLVAGAVQLSKSWPAIGDWAVAELIVRHIGRHIPLSGPYSARRGYNHPLPWVYALEWLPYHLFGDRSSAAPAMALWWNGLWATFVLWLLVRRQAIGLGLIALAALFVLASKIDGVVLLVPWNPYLSIVPGLALLFVAWRVAIGEGALLPLAVGLALWSTGAHLGFLPFSAALVLVSSISLVVLTATRAGERTLHALRPLVRPALVALAVGAFLVAPMLIDLALHGSRSNPARIVKSAGPGSATVGASQALKVLWAELAIPPAWTRLLPPYDYFGYHPASRVPLILVLVVVVAIAAWRRRAGAEIAGIALSLVALGAATLGLVHVDDTMLQTWYLLPAQVASVGLFSFVLWSGGRSIAELARDRMATRAPDLVRLVALPLLLLLGTTFAVAGMHTPAYFQTLASTTARLEPPIERRFPKGAHLIVEAPIRFDGYYGQSLVLQLDKAGYAVRVPQDAQYVYTAALTAPNGWPGTTLTLQISGAAPAPPEPNAKLIGEVVVPDNLPFAGRTLSIWEPASQ